MAEWTCPATPKFCPTNLDSEVKITDETITTRSIVWGFPIPNKTFNWNCKFKIFIDQ